jgi:hypothetical protein
MIAALVIGGIIVFTVGIYLFQRIFDTALSALFRNTLFRSQHKASQDLIKTPLTFSTQADFKTVKSRIFKEIVPPERNATGVPTLYISSAGTDSDGLYTVVFRKGTKNQCRLQVDVKVRAHGAGAAGSVDVVRWYLVDGLIQYVNDMKMIRQRVADIVLSLDPNAQLNDATLMPAKTQPAGVWPAAQAPSYGSASAAASYGTPAPNPPAQPFITPAPQVNSRYPVPDTRSWVDRSGSQGTGRN